MKFTGFALALFCAVAIAVAQSEIEEQVHVEESYDSPRVPREANPQGSVVIQGSKPLGGPDRSPSLSVDYQHRFYDRNGVNANAYGGLTKQPGLPTMPHAGISVEKNYRNGFIRGYSDVQRGPGGRYSPNVGIGGGFRFRRDVDNVEEEQEEEQESPRVRREANPQGSVVIQGNKPMSGPERRPSYSVDYQHRFYDRNGVNANAYGGLSKQPGQPAMPRGGLSLEKNYGNGFIRGYGDVQRGPGGRFSPNVGIGGGFRFRRDVDNVEQEQEEEQVSPRVRREDKPNGSIVIQGTKPMSGPDRRPSLSVDYQHRFYDRNGVNANAYGGLTKQPGLPVIPRAGLSLEKNYGNGFIRGYSDVQRNPGGRFSPNFGIGGGFRFRRDVDNVEEEQEEEQVSPRVRREDKPKGSIVIQGTKPMSGPDRRPSLSVDYQHRFYDRNGVNANAYGGLTKQPGLPVIPRAGLSLEKNYGNGFIRGYSDVQRNPGGRFSPNVGIGGGFRFRRDVGNVEEEQEEEQVSPRVRREDKPKGSIVIQGTKPMSGPDRRPSLSVDYQHRFYDRNGVNANAYGGLTKQPGLPVMPRAGLSLEKNYGNGFIRGYSDVQRGPGGRFSPNVGIGGGFRFRRDVGNVEEEQEEEQVSPRVRREDKPKGSIVIQGTKPMSGPDRRPSLSVDYQHRFYDRNGVNANAYGGLTKQPGLPVMPRAGLSLEKNYGNGFIRGYSDVQRGPGGRFSPNVGIGGGFRFRRDVDNFEEQQGEEQVVEGQEQEY